MKNKKKKDTKKKEVNKKDTKKKSKIRVKKNISKPRLILRIVLLLLLVGVIAYASWFGYMTIRNGGGLKGFLATAVGHDENTLKDLDRINVLVMGESGVGDGYKLADTIMVCSYNPKIQDASIMSIPRDTYVGKKDKNVATQNYLASYKMNAAYRNGTNIEETVECVNNLTGLDIKYYLIIDTDALIQLVDAIGGVTFTVPIDMDYDDPTQDLHIHLEAGEQLIDGPKAEQLLRFRHNNDGTSYPTSYGDNDLGRMRTQREFIQVTMKQLLKAENIFKITQILDIVYKNVTTNLDLNAIKDYVPYAVEFSADNLRSGVLPGTPELCNKIWIYTADKTATKDLVNDLFTDQEESSEDVVSTNTIDGNTTTSKGKIELLNGSGTTANLSKAADKLKAAGFEITKSGKTSTTNAKTSIINRTNKSTTIEGEIKTAIGVGTVTEGNDNSNVDFTVILGKDFK